MIKGINNRLPTSVLLLCVLSLTGCGTMKTKWRETRKLYREYVNTDPSIDFSDEGISDKGLQRLAALDRHDPLLDQRAALDRQPGLDGLGER